MNISDLIQKEVQNYDNLVLELRRISNKTADFFRRVSKDIEDAKKQEVFIKDYIVNHGMPIASPNELYSMHSFYQSGYDLEKARNYLSKELINDEMKASILSLGVSISEEFYTSIAGRTCLCLNVKAPHFLSSYFRFNHCVTSDDVDIFKTSSSITGGSLRSMFETLALFKSSFAFLMNIFINGIVDLWQEENEEENEEFNQFIFELNNIFDSIQNDDYECFKETINKIGISDFYSVYKDFSPMLKLLSLFQGLEQNKQELNENSYKKYCSMHAIPFDEEFVGSPVFCRWMINSNQFCLSCIENLPIEAKEAIESNWEEADLSWLKDAWQKWIKDEHQVLYESIQNDNKKPKTRKNTKKDHLHTSCVPKMIKCLTEGLVKGHDDPFLPKLISSKDGNDTAINQLVYLFTGETDNEVKLPYNLVWNDDYCLNGLRLLIYLLHFSGEFKDNDPLNALDDNDETSKDGISEVVKFKNTGRRPVFPIVEKAFGTGDKSVQNAKKPKGGNRDFLEQIVLFWWYCKNLDKAAKE